tara:strand:+ start:163 stop:525 length:363 start_codon:yes stop_codon:yes gene_type:complete
LKISELKWNIMNDKDNKLIALFMGLKQDPHNEFYLIDENKDEGYEHIHESCFLYDSSWDWLMPVIREVLMTIDIEVIIFIKHMFDSDELKANILDCDRDGAYKEVVELIKQIKTYRDGEH